MVSGGQSLMRWEHGNVHMIRNIRGDLEMGWDDENKKSPGGQREGIEIGG